LEKEEKNRKNVPVHYMLQKKICFGPLPQNFMAPSLLATQTSVQFAQRFLQGGVEINVLGAHL
jgi:hypothetical protein